VARYTELIARALQLPPSERADLVYAARVHDVGKIFVPERILNKAGPLSEDEFYLVKMHARVGGEIVGTIPESSLLQKAIAHHHEQFDGAGYPDGLRGEQIPLWARIIAVADAFVNLTSEHAFAPGKSDEQALDELTKMSGTRFDGMLVRVLIHGLKAEKTSSLET